MSIQTTPYPGVHTYKELSSRRPERNSMNASAADPSVMEAIERGNAVVFFDVALGEGAQAADVGRIKLELFVNDVRKWVMCHVIRKVGTRLPLVPSTDCCCCCCCCCCWKLPLTRSTVTNTPCVVRVRVHFSAPRLAKTFDNCVLVNILKMSNRLDTRDQHFIESLKIS
jgi:hypothetical protein